MDDCSSDGSFDTIVDKIKKLPNVRALAGIENHFWKLNNITIKLIKNDQNLGPSESRNKAVKASKAEFIALLDMDDIYYPTKAEKSLDVFKKFPHVGCVYSDYHAFDGTKLSFDYKNAFSYGKLVNNCIVSTNSIIARKAFDMVGGYDATLRVAEDYDLWLRLAEMCIIYHIPESLFRYRFTNEGSSFVVNQNVWAECLQKVHEKRIERTNNATQRK